MLFLIKFVTSKSRIVLMNKTFTIPRLELLGNVILSSLISVVYNSLREEIAIEQIFFKKRSKKQCSQKKARK